MTIIQLKYFISTASLQSFSKAAEACFVSQPTLSMQIQKLEDELGLVLFDRSKQPIAVTADGEEILQQAREVLSAFNHVETVASNLQGNISGELRIGIIPTVAPALVHRFVPHMVSSYPSLKLTIEELQTSEILRRLREDSIDVGIAAIPLSERDIHETHLYYEPFVAFIPNNHRLSEDAFILQSELDPSDILLLQEGHCFRQNVSSLCGVSSAEGVNLNVESGNFETLVRLAKKGLGMTLLPYLTAHQLKADDKKLIRNFLQPVPTRQIGLLVKRTHAKKAMIDILKRTITEKVPEQLRKQSKGQLTSPTNE